MTKIRNIYEFQSSFSFQNQIEQFELFLSRFMHSVLGKIYNAIPWDELIKTLGVKDPKSMFTPKGKIALMFLKNYCNVSDRKLIDQLNGNIEYQFFCGLYLGKERITNYKMVSKIRTELGEILDIEKLQHCLYENWKEEIVDKSCMTMDATCYESHLRYPTAFQLL